MMYQPETSSKFNWIQKNKIFFAFDDPTLYEIIKHSKGESMKIHQEYDRVRHLMIVVRV